MESKLRYFAGSFFWGMIAKLLDAAIKFLTIPFLLSYFGKENYGLLTLAIATNAYMQLLDMGMNTGGVKFFSQWLASGNYNLINRVARTNISFYLIIGLINSGILIVLGTWGESLFKVTPEQFITFRYLLYIQAAFCIINWINFVFNQLLIADEKMGFTQQVMSIRSIFNLFVIMTTLTFKWSLLQYFFAYLLVNVSIIIPYCYLCYKLKLIRSVLPAFYWDDFAVVLKYGLAILAMSIFQFTATQSRPLILGIFSHEGVGILSEYRIIEVFPVFIISFGGMLISIFLPKTSKAIQNNNRPAIERIAYQGTRYTSILVSLLCFPVILNAKEILTLYVGEIYSHLTIWLLIWVFTLTLYLHNSPVASLVLATGKTKMLIYSSAIACIVSIIINALLTNVLGVGSVVVGYLIYIIIQMSFYYFYFNGKVLGLKSLRVFKSFAAPTGLGSLVFLGVYFLKIEMASLLLQIVVKTFVWGGVYVILLILFKMINIKSLVGNLKKL